MMDGGGELGDKKKKHTHKDPLSFSLSNLLIIPRNQIIFYKCTYACAIGLRVALFLTVKDLRVGLLPFFTCAYSLNNIFPMPPALAR